MIEPTRGLRPSNPFASRQLEPGAIPFLFRGEQSIETLGDKFRGAQSRRFAIVGPHGSGKSTLMNELARFLGCRLMVLHSSTPRLAALSECLRCSRREKFCFVDGYEQLPFWGRSLLIAHTRLYRKKLCASAHCLPSGFEMLWETQVDSQVESYVIDRLLSDQNPQMKSALFDSDAWKNSRKKQGGNLRETLFDMYDWWRDTVDEFSRPR